MEKARKERVAQIVSEKSPFFRIYTGEAKLEDYLSISNIKDNVAPTFSDALNVYSVSTGLSVLTLSSIADIPKSTGLLNRIAHKNAHARYTIGAPFISAKHFFNLGRMNEGDDESYLRISLLFYDKQTGNLMLRSSWDGVSSAIEHLSGEGNKKSRAGYVSRVLIKRRKELEKTGKKATWTSKRGVTYELEEETLIFSVGGWRAKTYDPIEGVHTVKRNGSYIQRIIKLAENCLDLVPVYLVPCLQREELEAKRDLIAEHIERLSDLKRSPRKTEAEMLSATG